jgi:SAM-dependent methyltransferase
MTLPIDPETHAAFIGSFYSRFPYPWRPIRFDQLLDDGFAARFVCQDVGDFTHKRLPTNARIWVAGCGTNQALMAALRFGSGTVLGTDVSDQSLKICADNASRLGVTNLELRNEPIGAQSHDREFDLVICTGVIHHNPDPGRLLAQLGRALRPSGLLELMVYNEFHRREPLAFQEAIRILFGQGHDVSAARSLANCVPLDTSLHQALEGSTEMSDETFADTWMNPLEQAFTVDSLWRLADSHGLQIEAPCLNRIDAVRGIVGWDMAFDDSALNARSSALDDRRRWQLTNLLRLENSPMLWFYLGRGGDGSQRVTEGERDRVFLDTVFRRASARQRTWVIRGETYAPLAQETRVPTGEPRETAAAEVYAMVDGTRPMREILGTVGVPPGAQRTRWLRTQLTTTQFPYLEACP